MPHAEDLHHEAADMNWLLHPPYWFVHALPWPGGDIAEGAVAYAPIMIPRDDLDHDLQQILACADLIADRRQQRVVLFSDITRLLACGGASWQQLGIDWGGSLQVLADGGFPALYLTITQRAYMHVCQPASSILKPSSGLNALDDDERRLVRGSLARSLEPGWESFMQGAASRRDA